ncbi:50S ribosomal protein L31 [Patescibacteria group bacterium]|nr:50S ribosomal protein L31 [Patescibacteria group bacterium]MBU1970310.1 50S ribosomal protein L31 [Patescibacteria group bacterium]
MNIEIHPQVYKDAVVTCACGNSFTTISTKKELQVEICAACHPFYTGQKRYIDTEGQIDKFTKKVKAAKASGTTAKAVKKDRISKKTAVKKGPITLKDLRSTQ